MFRIFLTIKDIMTLTGRSKSGSWNYLQKVKKHFKKEPHQNITIREFCEYEKINEDQIYEALKIKK